MFNKCIVVGFVGLFISLSGCASQEGRDIRDFDFDWKFVKEDVSGAHQPVFDDSGWRDVQIPHDWGIEGPYSREYASGTGYLPGGIGWYRKTFALDESLRGKRIAVEFDGIYNNSEVWINGHSLGKRPFGYISFSYDLTPYVRYGSAKNVLAVRVDHSQFADSRWYTGSGIYRHVRLCITEPLHIAHWGTSITTPEIEQNSATVDIETTLNNSSKEAQDFTLVLTIQDAEGKTIASTENKQVLQAGTEKVMEDSLSISRPQLWSPASPTLYTLKSQIITGGQAVDETTTLFGIRQFRFDADKGFFLNGENMKIKGVCLHHDAGCLGAAVPEKVWRQRFEELKTIGCNAIRCSHNPPAPEFLDLCDEMGFLVIDEAFDEFTPTKNKWVEGWNKGKPSRAGYGEVFEEWAVRDIQDMIRRDRNHPSIILWSIGNEVDYANDPFSHPSMGDNYRPNHPPAENLAKYARMLADAVKELDTTRPVTAALANAPVSNIVGYADVLDVVGYNYQEQLYEQDHQRFPNRPLIGSENSIDLRAWEAVENNDYISGQFLWIGIDYLGEAVEWPVKSWTRGLFDLCGFKKPIGWFRQSLWAEEPMVYLACLEPRTEGGPRRGRNLEERWNWQAGQEIRVLCYTNCDTVELFVNGQSLGSKPYSEARNRTLQWQVPFEAGVLKAVGKRDGKAVCEYTLQTAGQPSRIELIADEAALKANGKDVACLEFRVVDEKGILISDAEHEITFEIQGPAEIIGIGNGNPASHESDQGNKRKTYQGRGLAILRSENNAGTVTLKASSPGLHSAAIILSVK